MKKKFISVLLTAAAFFLCACGNSSDSAEDDNSLPLGNKVETDYGTVTLCDYSSLSAEETTYEITDEDIDSEVENLLYDYVSYEEKDAAEEGDYVEAYITGTADGEVILDYSEEAGEPYDILLGYNEFGEELDEKLIGAAAGDEISITVTYDDDFEDAELAGLTVSYSISVQSVLSEILPELTDEFITDTLGYSSEEEMRSELEAELDSYYNSDAAYYAKEDLLEQVVDNSEFGDYDESLYETAKEDMDASYEGYAELLGVSTAEEVYDAFEMTDDDIESEILSQVYRTVCVYAIAKEQSIEVTDEDYETGLAEYAQSYTDYYGEEYTTDMLVEEVGEESLRYWILEDKVMDYLYKNATITQTVSSLDSGGTTDDATEE